MPTRISGGAVYVTDPLTTVFTPPASCSTILSQYSSWGDNGGVIHVLQNGYSPGLGTNSACYPPNFYNHNLYPGGADVRAVYSPGVCPSGYKTSSLWESEDVTSAICCPSGFDAATSIIGKCKKASIGSLTVAADIASSFAIATPFLAYDWALTIAWASSDLDAFRPPSAPLVGLAAVTTATSISLSAPSASPASLGSSSARTAITSSRPSRTSTAGHTLASSEAAASTASIAFGGSTNNTPPESSNSGISMTTGEAIGISVGIGVLLILLLAAAVFFLRRRRRERVAATKIQRSHINQPHMDFDHQGLQQKYGHYGRPVEMPGDRQSTRYEYFKPELEGTEYSQRHQIVRVELAGDSSCGFSPTRY